MTPSKTGRDYKRGAIMGLTVAEAFILLSFCLLLLFTWWQVDTERKSLAVAEVIGDMSEREKKELLAFLRDGFSSYKRLASMGVPVTDPAFMQNIESYSRFMSKTDSERILKGVASLDEDARLTLADIVEVGDLKGLKHVTPDVMDFLGEMTEAGLDLRDSEQRRALARMIALASKNKIDSPFNVISERLEKAALAQSSLVQALERELGSMVRGAGGDISADGTISLPQDILFDVNDDKIKNPTFLQSICSPWLSSMQQSGLNVTDLKIEGHASSEGPRGSSSAEAYLYNLGLSQRRAQNALEACLKGVVASDLHAWSRARLAAVGFSSNRSILKPDGSEDRQKSRRVMFSVALDQSQLIRDIKGDLEILQE